MFYLGLCISVQALRLGYVLSLVVYFCAGIETVGKNVLVVGRSKNVGMPIAMLLHSDRNHERPGGETLMFHLIINTLTINLSQRPFDYSVLLS